MSFKGLIYSANVGTHRLTKYDHHTGHKVRDHDVLYHTVEGSMETRFEAKMLSRQIKILWPFQSTKWTAWMDSSLTQRLPLAPAIDEWLKEDKTIVLIKHPWRNCAYDEIDECVRLKKMTDEEADRARRELKRREHPRDFGLWSLGFFVFGDNHFSLRHDWWHLYLMFGRDQIALPTLLRQSNLMPHVRTLDFNIYDNKYFTFKSHGT